MNFITNLFNKWGIIAVFILAILEYACFPIPSELVLPFAGFIANINAYSLIGVIVFSVIAGYLGCLICYLIGYYGGELIYKRIYTKFSKWQKGLDIASQKFKKYGNLSVFVCRLIPLCRTYISFLAGIFKQSLFKYSMYSILGIFVWNTVLISLGYILVGKWNLVSEYYNNYKFAILLIIGIILCVFLVYKLYKKKKNDKNINGD